MQEDGRFEIFEIRCGAGLFYCTRRMYGGPFKAPNVEPLYVSNGLKVRVSDHKK
jgi:hypothetical protein